MKEKFEVNGYVVTEIKEVETITCTLKVFLHWLRESGFKGKVQVIDGWFSDGKKADKVLFEIDV